MEGFRLFDTYKRYKIGQTRFITWLKQTAEKYGYNSGSNDEDKNSSSAKSKQQSGKLRADGSSSNIVRMSEFTDLAKAIVAQTNNIPGSIVQTLRDVIVQRKKAYNHYRGRSGHEPSSEDGHLHIIQVLEDVMKIFQEALFEGKASESSSANSQGGTNNAEAQMKNLFELLEIEQPAQDEEVSNRSEDWEDEEVELERAVKGPQRPRNVKKPSKSKKSSKSKKRPDPVPISTETFYEMEPDDSDVYFLIYCFFEDFNETREYLQERWCDYLDGIISLSAVAVITNTAIDMLQEGEKEMLPQIPKRSGLRDFVNISNLLFLEQGLAHVDYDALPAVKGEGLSDIIYEEANWIGLPAYWALSDCLRHIGPTAIPLVPPARELKGRGPHRSKKMMKWGKEVIIEIVGEACILRGLKRREGIHIPAEDELTRGLTEMLLTYRIPIWLVFATQIYLDIRYILESDLDRAHKELVAKGTSMKSTLSHYLEFQKINLPQHPKLLQLAIDDLDCWVLDDCFGHARSSCRTAVGVSGEGLEPDFYLRRNPLLCGLMAFRCDLTLNEHGLAMANIWGATYAMVHLYNAVKHILPIPLWKDMELVIAMHGSEYMFVGERPTNSIECLKRFELATGARISKFAQTGGYSNDQSIAPSGDDPRGLMPMSKVSEVFHERYCFANDVPVITLDHVETLLAESDDDQVQLGDIWRLVAPSSSSTSTSWTPVKSRARADVELLLSRSYPFLRDQFKKTQALTPIQLLDTLGSRVEQEAIPLTFNYLSMHERCLLLLRAIYAEFEKEIGATSWTFDESSGELPSIVRYLYILMIKDDQGMAWKEKKPGRVVERVGKIMQDTVEKGGEVEITAIRAALTALRPTLDGLN